MEEAHGGANGMGSNGTLQLTGLESHFSPPMVGLFIDDTAGT